MKHASDSTLSGFRKTMLKGGFAAALPGLAALVAAFTVPVSILNHTIGMGSMGVAALGVIFFCAAYFFYRGHWWACIPALSAAGWAMWIFAAKAGRLLTLYYTHNPIHTFGDVIAPFPVISLQLILVFIPFTIGLVMVKALRVSRIVSPQPINKFVWGAVGLWGLVVVLDCMNKFQ